MRPCCFASLTILYFIVSCGFCRQDRRIKLCGREFIRMVVMSCGSSRMKRFTPDHNQQPLSQGTLLEWLSSDQFTYLTRSADNEKPRGHSQDSEFSVKLRGSASSTEHAGLLWKVGAEVRGADGVVTPQPQSTVSRSQRDAGPAGVCCRSGCTMSELVQYC